MKLKMPSSGVESRSWRRVGQILLMQLPSPFLNQRSLKKKRIQSNFLQDFALDDRFTGFVHSEK
jgi:hypothetical protein